ncbi:MAG: PAS domain-containing sensor histidine kinase [Candidatus Kapaibacterium sp.]
MIDYNNIEYKVPLLYLMASIIWIMFSDYLLFNNIAGPENAKLISIIKGLFFVSATSLGIYYVIKKDVISIRKANEQLAISSSYYYSLFENSHTASMLLEPDTYKIMDVNNAAVQLYGYNYDTFKGMYLHDLNYYGKDNPPEKQQINHVSDRNYFKTTHKTAFENIIEVEIYIGDIKLDKQIQKLAVINNITEKLLTENALKVSEMRYKKLVENIPDVFYVYSNKKGLIYISPQILNLIGYYPSKTDTLSDVIYTHVFFEDKSKFQSFRKRVFDYSELGETSYRINDASKNMRWILDRVFLVSHTDDDIVIEGVLSDITEKTKLIDELTNAHAKINESLKLKNVILSNLNHELRTPLNGIIGFSKLIQRSLKDDENYDFIELVLESAYRLNNTLDSILTLNEIEAGHRTLYYEETSVKEFLGYIYESNKNLVGKKNLIFEIDIKDDIKLFTDLSILSQILFNLIDNAVKFTESGGIKLRGEFISKNGMWICFSVIDTGVGIAEEHISIVFEAFRQASEGINRHFEGMGIGLTICLKLINILNGKIEVDRNHNQGSTFKVYIPFKVPDLHKH